MTIDRITDNREEGTSYNEETHIDVRERSEHQIKTKDTEHTYDIFRKNYTQEHDKTKRVCNVIRDTLRKVIGKSLINY